MAQSHAFLSRTSWLKASSQGVLLACAFTVGIIFFFVIVWILDSIPFHVAAPIERFLEIALVIVPYAVALTALYYPGAERFIAAIRKMNTIPFLLTLALLAALTPLSIPHVWLLFDQDSAGFIAAISTPAIFIWPIAFPLFAIFSILERQAISRGQSSPSLSTKDNTP